MPHVTHPPPSPHPQALTPLHPLGTPAQRRKSGNCSGLTPSVSGSWIPRALQAVAYQPLLQRAYAPVGRGLPCQWSRLGAPQRRCLTRLTRRAGAIGVLQGCTTMPTGPSVWGTGNDMEHDTTTWGIDEAAQRCGVHPDTIRRLLRRGALAGAYRATGANGAWRIPPQALRTAGLEPGELPEPDPVAATLRGVAAALVALANAIEVAS